MKTEKTIFYLNDSFRTIEIKEIKKVYFAQGYYNLTSFKP